MMNQTLIGQLRREASAHHMCEENRRALMGVENISDAIALYKKTIDWALEEGYPRIDTLRKYFSNCEEYGVFIDKHFNGENLIDQQVYVFHNCTGTIRTGLNLDKKIIPMLYFANGCNMNIESYLETGSQIIVPLYIFGQNVIHPEVSDNILCRVFNFDTVC